MNLFWARVVALDRTYLMTLKVMAESLAIDVHPSSSPRLGLYGAGRILCRSAVTLPQTRASGRFALTSDSLNGRSFLARRLALEGA